MVTQRHTFSFSIVRPNVSGHAVPSHVQFQITGSKDRVKHVSDHLLSIANKNKSADAQVTFQTSSEKVDASSPTVRVESPRRVLLLGSGRVCAPVIKMLGAHENVFITIASDVESQARELMKLVHPSKCSYVSVKFPQDDYKLGRLVASTDVVISLLPATMHPKVISLLLSSSGLKVAEHAIKHKTNMVTASYVSDAMRELDAQVKAAGITILNEVIKKWED